MALSAARATDQIGEGKPTKCGYPMLGSSTTIFQGSLVVLDGNGYAKPGVSGTGLTCVGKALATKTNDGSSGDLYIEVEEGAFKWDVNGTAIDAGDVGSLVYVYDDHTVTKSSSSASIAGTVVSDGNGGFGVYSGLASPVDGTGLSAVEGDLAQLITDLAATTTAVGASLVGIEDSGLLFTATNVETALAEKIDGKRVANEADVSTVGGIPLIYRTAVASGANGDTDVTLPTGHKIRVLDAWAVLKGAGTAGCTLTVKTTATAISNAIDVSAGGDKAIFRASTIDDAQHEIAGAGKLRWSKASTGADFPGAECYVLAIRVA